MKEVSIIVEKMMGPINHFLKTLKFSISLVFNMLKRFRIDLIS